MKKLFLTIAISLMMGISVFAQQGEGALMIMEKESGAIRNFSKRLMDPVTGMSYGEPAPNIFSFNSPEGACPKCKGLGYVNGVPQYISPGLGSDPHYTWQPGRLFNSPVITRITLTRYAQ